jgi:stearoyl-CoA desaturase (Delta-9 desaturase)
MQRPPLKSANWANISFIVGSIVLTLVGLPLYIWQNGLDLFQIGLFVFFFMATGLSITLGYHRLFSHRSFKANRIVRFLTLVFGAAAFENSVLRWAADHRRHHKFADEEEDPYDISQGFFYAHIGWLLFKPSDETSLDYVKDLQRDPMIMWQHNHYRTIAIVAGFGVPMLLGLAWGGWMSALGGLLIAGVARVVFVHQMTFFINSLCHSIGRQPYSSRCTARDSTLMAFFTFGEGYHNFHHAFQHDYRNGVKPWQFDPTKWSIWFLHKLGLARDLRRVPEEKILLEQFAEQQRQLRDKLNTESHALSDAIRARLHSAQVRVQETFRRWEQREAEYQQALEKQVEASRKKLAELRSEFCEARSRFRAAFEEWKAAYHLALAQVA